MTTRTTNRSPWNPKERGSDGGLWIGRWTPSGVLGHGPAVGPTLRGLDREEREIKDNVLRMGSLVAEQILAALERSRRTTRRPQRP